MNKVAVLGIDGLDSELLSRFEKDLPNFRKIKEKSIKVKMNSVFPPDSPTAWTSIYTGMNPAEHGVILFKDPFTTSEVCSYFGYDISGKTFWDHAGNAGKKVCTIFPHMGYPVWPVNGIMVGRTNEVDIREFDIQTYPEKILDGYDLSKLQPITSYPINLGDIIKPTKELILNEVKLGLKLYNEVDWELYFIYFSSIDNIEHLFWMYYDSNDPEFEEGNPYKDVIPDFYKFYDKHVIGSFLPLIDPDTCLIIISDHGHAMRPTNVVNVNELLRENKLLSSKIDQSSTSINRAFFAKKLKKIMTNTINEYRTIGKIASKFLRWFPDSANLFTKTTPINWEGTTAYLSDPSAGLKAYSYAGVKIKKGNMDEELYDKTCKKIISLLLDIKEPGTSDRLVEWVKKRNEIYSGEFVNKYPDLLFKLRDDWGVGWDVNSSMFGKSYSHKLHSGNHRQETAVFFINGKNTSKMEINSDLTLMDVSSIILKNLGVKSENHSLKVK